MATDAVCWYHLSCLADVDVAVADVDVDADVLVVGFAVESSYCYAG